MSRLSNSRIRRPGLQPKPEIDMIRFGFLDGSSELCGADFLCGPSREYDVYSLEELDLIEEDPKVAELVRVELVNIETGEVRQAWTSWNIWDW